MRKPAKKYIEAVDRLGYVKAQIANWKAEEQELAALLRSSPWDVIDGADYTANIIEQNGARIDTTKVRKFVPGSILVKLWKPYKSTRVTVTARSVRREAA